ncbi:hypothetical protein [Streptomyces sp. NPDC006527]|uniref:hypothetical protein n=1 Tax=Streptomyces sp. NPDC006527 TaxID=3364749 RepID=UPI0036882B84
MRRVGAAGVVAGVTVLGMLAGGAVVVGAPALYFLTVYGCGEAEDRLAGALATEKVLDTQPPGAEREESYRSCDDDDLFVTVGARYKAAESVAASAPAPGSVLSHYRRAASADGWQAAAVPGCFTKPVGGTTAYLSVEEPDGGRFHVEITAEPDGGEWC